MLSRAPFEPNVSGGYLKFLLDSFFNLLDGLLMFVSLALFALLLNFVEENFRAILENTKGR